MNKKFIKTLLCSVMIFLSVSFSYACTNIIVSKGATVDGSVLVSYAADSHALFGELYHHPAQIFSTGSFLKIYDWDTGKYMGEIPQIAKTYQTVGNMNEHQVTITETTYGGRLELMDPDAIMDYGSLIYVTLQRAKT
ncbi:MAG: dipeptidase, partial [Bacteroidales bacterium]